MFYILLDVKPSSRVYSGPTALLLGLPTMQQDDALLKGKGDQWFERNRGILSSAKADTDMPLKLIEMYGLRPRTAVEIGCSNGWRLAEISARYGTQCVGVDPSKKAITEGMKKFPNVTFKRGIAAKLPVSKSFDLVIVNFVLHWVSREALLQSISEIDRVVSDGEFLIVGDFAPDHPAKTRYHHLTKQEFWTFKIQYPRICTATGLYSELAFLTYDHDAHALEAPPPDRRRGAGLLKKSGTDQYVTTVYENQKKKHT